MRVGQYDVEVSIKLGARKSKSSSFLSLLFLDSVTLVVNLNTISFPGFSLDGSIGGEKPLPGIICMFGLAHVVDYMTWNKTTVAQCLWVWVILPLLFLVNLALVMMCSLFVTPKVLFVIDSTKCLSIKVKEVELTKFIFNSQTLIKFAYVLEISSSNFSAKMPCSIAVNVRKLLAQALTPSDVSVSPKIPAVQIFCREIRVDVIEDRVDAPIYFLVDSVCRWILKLYNQDQDMSLLRIDVSQRSLFSDALWLLRSLSWRARFLGVSIHAVGGSICVANLRLSVPRSTGINNASKKHDCPHLKLDSLCIKRRDSSRGGLAEKWASRFGRQLNVSAGLSIYLNFFTLVNHPRTSRKGRSSSFDSVVSSIARLERFQNSLASEMDEQLSQNGVDENENFLSLTDAEYSEEDIDIKHDSPIWFGDYTKEERTGGGGMGERALGTDQKVESDEASSPPRISIPLARSLENLGSPGRSRLVHVASSSSVPGSPRVGALGASSVMGACVDEEEHAEVKTDFIGFLSSLADGSEDKDTEVLVKGSGIGREERGTDGDRTVFDVLGRGLHQDNTVSSHTTIDPSKTPGEKDFMLLNSSECISLDENGFISYENLKSVHGFIPGIDPTKKEQYLSDQSFVSVFSLTRKEFAALPKWKQDERKKVLGLF